VKKIAKMECGVQEAENYKYYVGILSNMQMSIDKLSKRKFSILLRNQCAKVGKTT
jgi:hypothetical protein